MIERPAIVAVSGFTSEVGKTTLVCELLRAFPGWEAIKMTRGHYRSCGKDPHACCVSHLLSDEPVIRSGREQTYAVGKDTGRYWDAGAANVHWVIVTDGQVEQGINEVLKRVSAPGVLIEGNSFLDFVHADLVFMVARAGDERIKSSARRALSYASLIYLTSAGDNVDENRETSPLWRTNSLLAKLTNNLPIYTKADLPNLVAQVRGIH
jgi:molybdopterin-guanine dinucleotide biosynthesis protein